MFGIIKPSIKLPRLRRFDLVFKETSKQIYWKLQYNEKVFKEFEGLHRFSRKMVLYSST